MVSCLREVSKSCNLALFCIVLLIDIIEEMLVYDATLSIILLSDLKHEKNACCVCWYIIATTDLSVT